MALVLGPVIGRVGGRVETIDRDLVGISGENVRHPITTVTPPPGGQQLIAFDVAITSGSFISTARPRLWVGSHEYDLANPSRGFVVVSAETVVSIQTRSTSPAGVAATIYTGNL